MTEKLDNAMDTVSLNDSRVEIQTFDRYKGRKGVTDRIAVLSSTLLRSHTHYIEAKKKTFKCISTKDKRAVCCEHAGDPDQKFGLVIFQYLTDENGSLLTEEKCTGKVKLWVVSETRYAELSQIHKEFPLLDSGFKEPQFDMTVKCTEENFQRMTFTPCRDAFWKRKEAWFDALKAKEVKAKVRLAKAMGVEMTELEIMDLLEVDAGRNPSMAGGGASGEIDVGDVLA